MGLCLKDVEKRLPMIEAFLRICTSLILVSAASLIGLDSQTKLIAYFKKTVTFRDLQALEAAVYIDSMAAAYGLLQLLCGWCRGKPKGLNSLYLLWLSYLLDQIAVYVVFAGNLAATEHSLLVVTGSKELQWTKWCNKYTRFCFQIGAAVVSGFIAAALMAVISTVSAFNLFRLYSPKTFLLLKTS